MGTWLQNELQPLARDALSADSARGGRASSSRVPSRRLLDDHVAGRADNSRKIWALLTFSLWYDRYAEGAVAPAGVDAERLVAEA